MSKPKRTCLPVSFSGEIWSAVSFSRPYSRRQIRVFKRRASDCFEIHFVARRYRRRHSRVNHMRSESVMGALGLFWVEAVGISVQEATVESKPVYFPN